VLNIDGTLILVLNWYVFLEKILQVNGWTMSTKWLVC